MILKHKNWVLRLIVAADGFYSWKPKPLPSDERKLINDTLWTERTNKEPPAFNRTEILSCQLGRAKQTEPFGRYNDDTYIWSGHDETFRHKNMVAVASCWGTSALNQVDGKMKDITTPNSSKLVSDRITLLSNQMDGSLSATFNQMFVGVYSVVGSVPLIR